MARPDTTPLSLTPAALSAAVKHCQYSRDNGYGEACGFIFGHGGVGSRVVAIMNAHPHHEIAFSMHPDGVLDAMKMADEYGEDLIAVYHSHLGSPPLPSEDRVLPDGTVISGDKSTPDHEPAYLIIGLKDAPAHVACRAWRFDLEFVGQPRVTEVLLHVSEDGEPYVPQPALVPWALTPGNKVRLTYQRPGHANRRTITAEITGLRQDPVSAKITLDLNPRQGTDPKSMPIERIKAVRVLRESPAAGRVRQRAATYARALAHAVENDEFGDAANYGAYLVSAYPGWLAYVESED